MVQGYYTLDEAARLLGMDAERLNQMAQRREIRAFADRGTWRFRTQDVEEMARRQSQSSNPDLQLGEAEKSKSGGPRSGTKLSSSPSPQPKSGPKGDDDAVFDFSLGATPDPLGEVQHEIVIESPSSHKLGKGGTNISPAPKPGSDSDVHLVFDAGADYSGGNDSDVKISDQPPSSKILKKAGQAAGSPLPRPQQPPARKPAPPAKSSMDSGVRLVPMEEDSAVSLGQQTPAAGTDSDIRLTPDRPRRSDSIAGQSGHSTEDINLDEELRRADEISRAKQPRSKAKPKSEPRPVESPSDEAFQLDDPGAPAGGQSDRTAELRIDNGEDAEVPLGELEAPKDLAGSTNVAGINLHAPADSGVNLERREESSDSLEFELSLEPEATPRPLQEASDIDSSGEFELTLDDDSGVHAPQTEDNEATANLSVEGEQDIFETDFDLPAVESKPTSGSSLSQSVDTELESSDFDLSVGEDSGSQVVALEGEEADEGSATVAYKGSQEPESGDESLSDSEELLSDDELDQYEEVEGQERLRRAPVMVAAPQASWGLMPALVMLPCVTIMFLLACMGFELMNNMAGYNASSRPTATLVKHVAGWLGKKVGD
jgi:excisionase family DNA binding protein